MLGLQQSEVDQKRVPALGGRGECPKFQPLCVQIDPLLADSLEPGLGLGWEKGSMRKALNR